MVKVGFSSFLPPFTKDLNPPPSPPTSAWRVTEVGVAEGGRPGIPLLFRGSHLFGLLGPFGNSAGFPRGAPRACWKSGSLGGFCVSATKSLYPAAETAIFPCPHWAEGVRVRAPDGRRGAGAPRVPGGSLAPSVRAAQLPPRPPDAPALLGALRKEREDRAFGKRGELI